MTNTKSVHITINNGRKTLVYNPNMMEINKEYSITWYDEILCLKKKNNRVEVSKFYPDKYAKTKKCKLCKKSLNDVPNDGLNHISERLHKICIRERDRRLCNKLCERCGKNNMRDFSFKCESCIATGADYKNYPYPKKTN